MCGWSIRFAQISDQAQIVRNRAVDGVRETANYANTRSERSPGSGQGTARSLSIDSVWNLKDRTMNSVPIDWAQTGWKRLFELMAVSLRPIFSITVSIERLGISLNPESILFRLLQNRSRDLVLRRRIGRSLQCRIARQTPWPPKVTQLAACIHLRLIRGPK